MRATKKPTDEQIKRYMHEVWADHMDWETGECSATTLAEDAADHFGVTDPDTPEIYFELAQGIAERMSSIE